MPLPAIDCPISLTGAGTQIGLPHIDTLPAQLGFASGASQQLQLHNDGAAPLMIELASAPDGVTAEAVTIAPGADGAVQITAADLTSNASLVLSTNDPNNPTLTIALDANASGQTNSSPTDDAEAGGCNAAGHAPGTGVLLVGIALVVVRRRRRRA